MLLLVYLMLSSFILVFLLKVLASFIAERVVTNREELSPYECGFEHHNVSLLNTIILLTSGITVTWAHHAIMNNFFNKSVFRLFITVVLGVYFLAMQ